jgi:hypothetical protein
MMNSMQSPLYVTAPLSPTCTRRRHPRIPLRGRNLPLFLFCLVGSLFTLATAEDGWYQYEGDKNSGYQVENFDWPDGLGFDEVQVLPVSCINYNGGHMIKYELHRKENSYNCHFNELGSFVVSIAHYMRAYFNYLAITNGKYFSLPGDAGYLNVRTLKIEVYSTTHVLYLTLFAVCHAARDGVCR